MSILIRYHWNQRFFEANASAAEQALMQQVDWDDAAEILQNLKLYHRGLAAPIFAAKILGELRQLCADNETAQTLLGYASTL